MNYLENCRTVKNRDQDRIEIITFLYPPGERGRAEMELALIAGEESYPCVETSAFSNDGASLFYAPDFDTAVNDPCDWLDRSDLTLENAEEIHWDTVRKAMEYLGYMGGSD